MEAHTGSPGHILYVPPEHLLCKSVCFLNISHKNTAHLLDSPLLLNTKKKHQQVITNDWRMHGCLDGYHVPMAVNPKDHPTHNPKGENTSPPKRGVTPW